MNVLIGCERSGTVRDAFIRAGHNAISCDLEPTDSPGPHIQSDIHTLLDNSLDKWDLIILHPECNKVCVSGNHKYAAGKSHHGERLAAAKWIEKLWIKATSICDRVALENSMGVLPTITSLGKPSQIIQPYQFGHDASKSTCLWLHGLPCMAPTEFVSPRIVWDSNGKPWMRWSNQTDSGQNRLGPSDTRSADRAKTYQGVANAMAQQWTINQIF